MPDFRYTALSEQGERVAGVLAGVSESAIVAELEARKLSPIRVAAADRQDATTVRGVSPRVLGQSYAQLADLLRAGVPLLRSLRLLGNRKSKPRLAMVFSGLADAVAEGEELAEAMSKSPRVFHRVHVAMVRAGEKGGFLEDVLDRLAGFVLGQAELRGKIMGSLIYPAVLIGVGVLVLGAVFGFLVPMFRPLFDSIEGGLPAITRLVFGVSDAVGVYGPLTALALAALAAAGWRLLKRADVRERLSIIKTRVPLLGPVIRSIAAARFCRMMGTLLGNGVPMIQAMQIAREASGNVLMERAIEAATESVRAGETLAEPLARSGLFGDDVIEMISVAEQANNLDHVLLTIADTLEARLDRMLGALVKLVEPLMLLAIAGVVVVVAIGLLLPMTKISAQM